MTAEAEKRGIVVETMEMCDHRIFDGKDGYTHIGWGWDFNKDEAVCVLWKPNAEKPVVLYADEVSYIVTAMLRCQRLDRMNFMGHANDYKLVQL